MIDISTGIDGSIWAIGADRGVYSYHSGKWTRIDGSGTRIDVDGNGQPWIINA